ncbi:MAG: hypothetical protein NTY37_11440 [Methanothrix sp.]|nr:hypothetical protein [Methanothrix sp.]
MPSAAVPGNSSDVVAALPGSRLRSWPLPVGRAVRGYCAIVRAGRRPVGPGVRWNWSLLGGFLCVWILWKYIVAAMQPSGSKL